MTTKIKTRRAWDGRLNRIDGLMSWLYDHAMTETEQKQKDTIFYRYYRFYNDGDRPRGYRYGCGMSVEQWLEHTVNQFMCKMLAKYRASTKTQYRKSLMLQMVVSSNAANTGVNKVSGLLNVYHAQQYANRYNALHLKQVLEDIEQAQRELAKLETLAGDLIINHYKSSKFYDQDLVNNDIPLYVALKHR